MIIKNKEYERDVAQLENIRHNKGKSAAIFKMREKLLGNKKATQEQIVVFNPKTGKEVFDPEEIKMVSLEYCVSLLTNREPKPNYKEIIKWKESLHKARMEEVIADDVEELPFHSYTSILEFLKKKDGSKYDFILKAGKSLQMALFNLFQIIWKTEKIPVKWQESTLIELYKGRGRMGDFDNMRYIHIRNDYLKILSQIVISYAKDNLIDNMSKYQIACKPGHRPSEHLYVMKSVMAKYHEQKKCLLLSSWDIKKIL